MYLFFFLSLEKGTGSVATRQNDSSVSGHRFTVDESSIYWTQQAHEDQQPQFKNDHHKKPAGGGRPTVESLQPPPQSSPSSSPSPIYQTDDQHDGRRRREDGDKRFVSTRRKDDATDDSGDLDRSSRKSDGDKASDGNDVDFNDSPTASTDVSQQQQQTTPDVAVTEKTEDFRDQTDGDLTNGGAEDRRDGSNWKSEQHRWTSDNRLPEDEDASSYAPAGEADGYQSLTCRVTNNFYTHYRW